MCNSIERMDEMQLIFAEKLWCVKTGNECQHGHLECRDGALDSMIMHDIKTVYGHIGIISDYLWLNYVHIKTEQTEGGYIREMKNAMAMSKVQ